MNRQRTLTKEEKEVIRERGQKEWKYFRKVYLSLTAAAKMLTHADFGEPKEVMGLLQGSFQEEENYGVFYVNDIISLPVQASETRVTADMSTYTLMAAYSQWINKIHTHEIMGWYHSHPDYGCWLSGIDVDTQALFQGSTDPFLALVVDPINSSKLEKIDIGAFRTYPKGFKNEAPPELKDVPRKKTQDFGHHCQRYYELAVELVASESGQKILKNVQKLEWASEISHSGFFKQIDYLTAEAEDEKLDIEEYLEMRQSPTCRPEELSSKEKSTLKKVAYYTKGRNISLLDSAVKSLLF